MKKRIAWIDTYRGILILLVVLNHQSLAHPVVNEALLAVRMPAFFFISGFLLSDRYQIFMPFAYRRLRQLIVPYFLFFVLNWLFWVVALAGPQESITRPLMSMLYGCVNTPGGTQNINAAPLWFITTLFLAELYFFWLRRWFQNGWRLLAALLGIGILGYLSSRYATFRMPWNAEVALTAALFYGLGYWVKKEGAFGYLPRTKPVGVLLLSLFLVTAIYLSLESRPHFDLNDLGSSALLTYVSGLFGIAAMVLAAHLIGRNRFLEYLGRNTYIILAFHLSVLYLLHGVFKRLGFDFDVMIHSDLWGGFYLVLSIVLLVPLIEIVNRFTPSILYRQKQGV